MPTDVRWQYQDVPPRTRTRLAGTDLEVEVQPVAVVGNWGRPGYRLCRVRYAVARWVDRGRGWAWFQVQVGETGPMVSRTCSVGKRDPFGGGPVASTDGRVKVWRVAQAGMGASAK